MEPPYVGCYSTELFLRSCEIFAQEAETTMNVKFAYLGHSTLSSVAGGQLLSLAPNLAREAVSFDAPLLQPLRFREAISALHDVVISDLRFEPRDKTAYEEWKKNERSRIASLRAQTYKEAKKEILARRDEAVPP